MNNPYAGYAGQMHAELIAAESRLAGARANFRQALKDAKRPTSGIFSETIFVPRSLMESKLADLEAANSRALKAALERSHPDDRLDPDRDQRELDDDDGPEPSKRKKKPVKETPAEKEPDEPDVPDEPVDNIPSRRELSAYEKSVRATAAAIVLAGKKRRGEI